MTSILYIGGTGTISAACVRRSVALGHEVAVLNRGSALRPIPSEVELIEADIRDASAVRAALGDRRWTDELILSGWYMAGSGQVPDNGLNYRTGDSGGGFDRLDFKFLPAEEQLSPDTPVDLALPLNRRGDGLPVLEARVPWYGGGMSYGSVSEQVMISRARAALTM